MSRKIKKRLAILTMGDHGILKFEDPLAFPALADIGWEAVEVSWHAPPQDWRAFDAAVVRSTWDYHEQPDAFFDVLTTIEKSGVPLFNSLDQMKWNMDKRYLRDLEEKGILLVPTRWGHGDPRGKYGEWAEELGAAKLVLKPRISASAKDTYRIGNEAGLAEVAHRFSGRDWMVQPFMEAVPVEGEFSLFYFGGELSHTVLKRPESGDFRVQEEYGGVNEWIRSPEDGLTARADEVMAALDGVPLYARVDMVRRAVEGPDREDFCLMEVELIEPTLFFSMDPDSPERFARAFAAMVNN